MLLAFHPVEVGVDAIDVRLAHWSLPGLAGSVGANELHLILLKAWLDSAVVVGHEEAIFHGLLDLSSHLIGILELLLELGYLCLHAGFVGKRLGDLGSLALSLLLVLLDLLL